MSEAFWLPQLYAVRGFRLTEAGILRSYLKGRELRGAGLEFPYNGVRYEIDQWYTAKCYPWPRTASFVDYDPKPPHSEASPVADCACGFWGIKNDSSGRVALNLRVWHQANRLNALGIVEFRGRVIEHEHGYRAEKMRVVRVQKVDPPHYTSLMMNLFKEVAELNNPLST